MRKAQGALEYLIIIAAVLAIAAIVVLFLTGAFKSSVSSGGYSVCKNQASSCNLKLATGGTKAACYADCLTACKDTAGFDAVSKAVVISATSCTALGYPSSGASADGCNYCVNGTTSGW